jgi:hypothetical protein
MRCSADNTLYAYPGNQRKGYYKLPLSGQMQTLYTVDEIDFMPRKENCCFAMTVVYILVHFQNFCTLTKLARLKCCMTRCPISTKHIMKAPTDELF